jgi:integrase/recombinase XerD
VSPHVGADLAPSTRAAYASDLAQWTLHQGARGILAATPADVRAWLDALAAAGLRPATRARKLSALRWLYGRVRAADPTALVVESRLPRRHPQGVSFAECTALLAAPDVRTPRGVRDAAMLQLLYASGLRVSELVGLGLGDVDMDQSMVRVLGKGDKRRLVPFGEVARDAVRTYVTDVRGRWAARHDSQHLFLTDRGGPITRQGFWKLLGRYARVAGIERTAATPRALRAAFAARLREGGAHPHSIADLLGVCATRVPGSNRGARIQPGCQDPTGVRSDLRTA